MSAAEAAPLHVTLLRHGDLIAVDVAERGTLIPRSEVRVDDAFLRDLAAEIEHVAVRRGAGTEAALARVGGLVFSHLLTDPARRLLRDAPSGDLYLRLDERLVHVPWELGHDGERFLLDKFRIGRQVITGRALPAAQPKRSARDRLRVLVVADPTESLPQAAAEGERLCAVLDQVPGVDLTLLAGKGVRRIPLLAALQDHDVVHFAGHSHFDAEVPERSGWRLADGVLCATDLAKLNPPPFLVFSNSCEAGASAAWQGDAGYEGRAFGIGSAFLLAGVPSYVGTFWVVHDLESVAFATTCYRSLAAGRTLGDALQDARGAVSERHGRDGLTWASYLLYGDPSLRPLPSQAEPAGGDAAAARDASPPVASPPTPPPPGSPAIRPLAPPAAPEQVRFHVSLPASGASAPIVARVVDAPQLVGRDAELERLSAALDAVRAGERRVVLISGPPGIGKTTLVDAFLARARTQPGAAIAHGQAVEHYGAGEAYLPLLEALGRLATDAGRPWVERLRRHAPSWLAQLPGLVEPAEHEALAGRTRGSTRDRMLRELADLLDASTAERPLVLALEDLHWSDHSTIEAVAYLAQRRGPARLLVVATYRPADVATGDHPLRAAVQELLARRHGEELALELLGESDVERYLKLRLGAADVDAQAARLVHRRTDGHPLFLVNVVDLGVREGLIASEGGRVALRRGGDALASLIPRGLVPMIERQIEALAPEERQVLEAAAVAGAEFSIATVAAALDAGLDEIDDRCENLAWRGQFLRAAGMEEWPDGTIAGRYRFVHALYHNALYERVAEARRVRLHRRIAERKAAAFGDAASEIAGELAAHFEAARDARRAIDWRERAGDLAVRRHADREAAEHFRRAITLLSRPGAAPDARQRELEISIKLATPLMSTAGYAARDVQELFERAHALSRQVEPGPHLAPLLRGLVSFHQVSGRPELAREVGLELLTLCAGGDDCVATVQAHYGHGVTLYDLGELEGAQHHLEAALARYDVSTHPTHVSVYGGYDPGIACRCWLAWTRWLGGEPDGAVAIGQEGLALAEQLGHPFSLGFALMAVALVHLQKGDPASAAGPLARATEIADEYGFPYTKAIVRGLGAWLDLTRGRVQEAIAGAEESLAQHEASGAALASLGFVSVLGFAKALAGDVPGGLAGIEAGVAQAEKAGKSVHVVMLYRARGELLMAAGPTQNAAEAERSHERALHLARAIGSPTLELQAAIGMARLYKATGRGDRVHELIEPIYARFRPGLECGPLREARALLGLR